MTVVPSPISPTVEKARRAWISRLIDLSQRNNLLYFRPLKVGTLDLTTSDRDALAELLSGKSVSLKELLPDADRVQIAAKAKQIARKAKENAEERGLETLYLAAGMATWESEAEGKRAPEAAVLLVPVTLDLRGRSGPALRRSGEPQVNPVFLHVMSATYRLAIDADELLKAADTDPDRDDDPFDLDALLSRLVELARGVPQFGVRRTVILGNFSFQKMAMVRDLRDLGEQLAQNDVVAALAGDVAARSRVIAAGSGANGDGDVDPRTFDDEPPESENLVLDTDASQHKAIRLGQRGKSLVIQGPPGTGKSQVIANLIVALAAEGKRLLFVAEKRAALQVVLDRLQRCGLGHLALDLHGAETSRKVIAGRLRDALANVDKGEPVASDAMLKPFAARRAALNAHARRLHAPRPPAGMSAFEIQSRLLMHRDKPAAKTRFRREALMKLTPDSIARAKDALGEAAALGDLFTGTSPSPWARAKLADGHAVQDAMDLVAKLADESWPNARAKFSAAIPPVRSTPPNHVEEAAALLRVAGRANRQLAVFQPAIFQEDLHEMASALAPAEGGALRRLWATMTSVRYRRAKGVVAANAKTPIAPGPLMLEAVKEAADLSDIWKAASFDSAVPVEIAGAESTLGLMEDVHKDLATLSTILNDGVDLAKLPFDQLESRLAALHADTSTPRRVPALRRVESIFAELGLNSFINELRQSFASWPDAWPALLEGAWLRSCLEHAWAEDAELAAFDGRVHAKLVAEFARLDRERLELAAKAVAIKHVREASRLLSGLPQQASLVRREAEKKMRHLPFRRLMEHAPDVVAGLFPCFMCSPLSVSQLLPGERRAFDVVVFDEASQVLPEDAVASLVRGGQAIVAGDEHQLPPTQFFASGTDEDEESAEDSIGDESALTTEGFESLLSMMKSFVPAPMLEWHYRSRDERLIAFSNRHIYGGRLITFPGPGAERPAMSHVLVNREEASGGGDTGDRESGSAEVRRVVEMVLQHAREQLALPAGKARSSLGVIALGITHARRVEAALDAALEDHPELEAFFDPNAAERFFVKNLERVQGDERDVIFLTLGVEPDKSGRASLTRFGPLNNREQGYRRLNVAITRARQRMVVVSSFAHHGLDVAGASRGVDLLRQYLQYAASGGADLGDGAKTDVPLNAFEADVSDALQAIGIGTAPQWGASRYRIDLVARHPSRPGRVVLAIECDGATYHSAPTARDRDRLRQQHLEALGWRFHRIWSTDWFNRREQELARVRRAFDDSVAFADASDARSLPD
jgi:very-short-patch-repair endonuclease